MVQQAKLGPLSIRLDFALVVAGVAAAAGPAFGAALAAAIFVHEGGHALAARLLGGERHPLVLQLGGGGLYVRRSGSPRAEALMLLAGPLASLILGLLGWLLFAASTTPLGRTAGWELRHAAFLWTAFQIIPFPPTDGGLLLCRWLEQKTGSATAAWRIAWAVALASSLLAVTLWPRALFPALWLIALAMALGRTEAGFVRHLDAFQAFERGEHRAVLEHVAKLPRWIAARDRAPLAALGLRSALELEDPAAVERFAAELPAHHQEVVRAATWLLASGRESGARLAERALDALDAERTQPGPAELERWADLAFYLAVFEAEGMRPESALGLLERAADLGFDDLARLETEPRLARVSAHPRFTRLTERLGGAPHSSDA